MDWVNHHWLDLMAIGIIVTGFYWCFRREVGVGWQGFKPSFYIRGLWAVFLGIALIGGGASYLFMNSTFMKVDTCLDSGGSYNYQEQMCEYA
ncbi:hypothetical protein [Methylophaga sp.]|jgi:hypothetical protein|uniref:hypothetical protein n=1 Tax=Methylophaga sp. TaxID=2024840 RepID=UPI0027279C03|nr:hypothetical protein [Methylophaga sp.]MDO8826152.1 hypothetical protein [Methylophaga sp.]